MFDHIIGNDQAKSYLTHTAQRGTVGNSLLFAGPAGVGKSLFAEAFAKLLICQNDPEGIHRKRFEGGNHPDLRIYKPEGKVAMHSIGAMRQFSEEVYLAPAESDWKVFIVHDADRMLTYSANALLKTFEEPPKNTVIILLTDSPESLLPTVLSRCRTIHFHPISEELIRDFLVSKCGKTAEIATTAASMANGSIGQAIRLAEGGTNPLREILLAILAKGGVRTYKELTAAVATLSDTIEADKKEIEAEVRSTLLAGAGENLNALQKQAIEKEIEGAVAIHSTNEAHALFDVILGWYRDLELLKEGGNPAYFVHRDYAERYARVSNSIEIEKVQKIIRLASMSIERSTSIQIALENLFLKLNLI